MDFWSTLLDVVILLSAALVLGVVFERLRQSAILGYLLAGTLLGPGALRLVSNDEAVASMAELGVALLLFSIGLEFSWRRLRSMGPIALGGGTLQIVVTAVAGTLAALALGLSPRAAAAVGLIIAPSSTACVLRMLTERAEIDSVHGRNALGILLLQDIAIVPLVLLVTALGGRGSLGSAAFDLGKAVGLAILLVAVFLLLSNFVLPRLLDAAALTKNRELPILLAIVTFIGATWGAHALSLSPALGAFVAGVLLAESPFATQIRADVSGLRTLFVTLFFASVGMLADPRWIWAHPHLVTGAVAAIVVGKGALIWPIARIFGNLHRHALATGICLAQVGEFSYVLANIALASALLTPDAFQLIASSTLVTLLLTPFLVSIAPAASDGIERRLAGVGLIRLRTQDLTAPPEALRGHVIIVGMGPAARAVIDALRPADIPLIVVELNPRAVARARQQGIRAVFGDATRPEVLDHLGVQSASSVVITVPEQRTALQIIRLVRAEAPHVPIIARARYHVSSIILLAGGAHQVIDEEEQVGRSLGAELLKNLTRREEWPEAGPDLEE